MNLSTISQLHTKACAKIESLRETNIPAADRVESLMNRALAQYFKNDITTMLFRNILTGIAKGEFTVLINHFRDADTTVIPSSINNLQENV